MQYQNYQHASAYGTSEGKETKIIHEIDVRVTKFVFENLVSLIDLSRKYHRQAQWEENTPIYILNEFQLPLDSAGSEDVKMTVAPGTALPPEPVLQQWHTCCLEQDKFATHIHLACIWPNEGLMSLLVIAPHVFVNVDTAPLSHRSVLKSFTLTATEFAARWPSAVQIYRGLPQRPPS
jgi:hypothetical protein